MSKDPKSTHYDAGGIEAISIIRAKLTSEQYEGYLLGNALKYALRMNFRGDFDRDLEKIQYYIKWMFDERKLKWGVTKEDVEAERNKLIEIIKHAPCPYTCGEDFPYGVSKGVCDNCDCWKVEALAGGETSEDD